MPDLDSYSRPTTDQCISEIAQILAIGVCRMHSRVTILVDTPDDETLRERSPNCLELSDAPGLTVHSR
ncbi:MAG: hypothetical protein JNM43_02910 [Planctomycetaceae bacterium]|jgi:hypothetical protein|nr:hypothetical protein [Planctomycetaceae bacterium]